LLGRTKAELGGSEYLYVTAGLAAGEPPALDLEAERALQRTVLRMIQDGDLHSAHDCSEGGLACALAESALGAPGGPVGVEAAWGEELRPIEALFAESQGRIVVSCAPDRTDAVLSTAERHRVPARRIGRVVPADRGFTLKVAAGRVTADLETMADAYFETLARVMDTPSSPAESDL